MKHVVRISLIALLVVSLLSFVVSAKPVTVKLAVWGAAQETNELMQIINRINDANKDTFKIEVINIPSDYYDKLQVMIAGGTPPDIFYLDHSWTPAFAARNVLLELDSLIENDPDIDLNDYFPNALLSAQYNGKTYGLPWIAQPVVMYYNRTMFDEAGLEYPDGTWDWDKFLEVAKKLTQDVDNDGRIDKYGYIQTNGWPPLEMWVWQNGGRVFSEDGKKILLDSPEAVEAIQFMADLVNKHKVSPDASTIEQMGNIGDFFRSGRIGMFFGGAADGFYEIKAFDIGVAPVPFNKEKATMSWVANLHIFRGVKNKEVVWKAYKQILDGIHHWKIVPPRRSLAADIRAVEPRMPEDRVKPILESMEYARSPIAVVNQNQIGAAFTDYLWLPVLRDKKPAAEAVKALIKAVEPLL